jgi:hypothetical protein
MSANLNSVVPSPDDKPPPSADELLDRIEAEDGRVFRMREAAVFVLTSNPALAQWLISIGGSPYLPRNMYPTDDAVRGAYRDAKDGPLKWDIYVHRIEVTGEEGVWEAARRRSAPVTRLHAVSDA